MPWPLLPRPARLSWGEGIFFLVLFLELPVLSDVEFVLNEVGFTESQARAVIATPFWRPTPATESPERPVAAGDPLASALSPAALGPAPSASKQPHAELVSV